MRVAQKGYEDQRQLHWNAYRHFRREVRREIRFAEKEHVRSEILKSKCKTNSNWRILNRYIPRKNTPLATVKILFS